MPLYINFISDVRIGLQIRAKASSDDRVVVKFKSSKSSQYPGFSCRVSSQPSPVNQVLGGEVIDIGTADTPDENENEDNSTSSGNSGKFFTFHFVRYHSK